MTDVNQRPNESFNCVLQYGTTSFNDHHIATLYTLHQLNRPTRGKDLVSPFYGQGYSRLLKHAERHLPATLKCQYTGCVYTAYKDAEIARHIQRDHKPQLQ